MFYKIRARKKKRLTDPVAIIPFPSQNLREKLPATPKTSAPSISQAMMEKPEPKTMVAPSGKLQTSSFSIKKMMQPVEGEISTTGVDQKDLPRNSFHFDDVKMHWRRFANEMKSLGKETFYNAMIKREPKIKDDVHLTLMVDNQVQVDYINAEIENLITYLRNSLKNFDIQLTVELSDNQESETKFLTGTERFAALSRKYPNLHSLKTTFNLDIDY